MSKLPEKDKHDISRDELQSIGLKSEPEPKTYEETVVMSRDEFQKMGLKREPDTASDEEPLSRLNLDDEAEYQAIVAMSKEELKMSAAKQSEPVAPVSEPEPPASESEPPASEPEAPASEPEPPASEPEPPASEPEPPASESEPPASESEPPASESASPVSGHDYQATIVMSRDELHSMGLKIEPESVPEYMPEPLPPAPAQDYQATIAMSRDELQSMGLKTEPEPEPESTPGHIPEPPAPEQDYQATIAISRDELQSMGLKSESEPESEPESAPEYMPEPPAPEQDYQATVAISRDQLQSMGLKTEPESASEYMPEPPAPGQDYQATVAISRDELQSMGLGADSHSEEPPADDMPEKISPDTEARDESEPPPETTLAVVPADISEDDEAETGLEDESESYDASELEKTYYRKWVRKDRGDQKYRIQRKLIAGGMGAILKVVDQDLLRTSAMKVILPSFRDKDDALSDFVAEAKITGLLEHPNIIPVHELGLLKDTGMFFTMKLASAEALIDVLAKIKAADSEYVEKYNTYHLLNIFRKVCDAVSFAHSKNIIHQDIKPHNIMVGDYGEVLLMDWGIARFIGDFQIEKDPVMREIRRDIEEFAKAKDDIIKGSPTYMAPEQVVSDPRFIDRQTDIFLLGSTLYHMFTLEPPYFGKDIYEILHKAESVNFVPPEIRSPDRQIPDGVCRIIIKAMSREKGERYGNVEELAKDVDDLISGKWSRQDKKLFPDGSMLMQEGESGDEAYLILNGKVEVFIEKNNQKIVLATLHSGDVIGEMTLISREKVTRSASVQAVEDTEAAVLTKNVVAQNLKKLPRYMEKIVSTLTDRLRTANQNIHPHATLDCTYIVLKQLRMIFKDQSNNKIKNFKIPYRRLIEEIASDLGIADQKVEDVLTKAIDADLIVSRKNKIQIPDIVELARFTNFTKPS